MKAVEEENMMFIGAMRSNMKGVVTDMSSTDNRDENSTVVWFEKTQRQLHFDKLLCQHQVKGGTDYPAPLQLS